MRPQITGYSNGQMICIPTEQVEAVRDTIHRAMGHVNDAIATYRDQVAAQCKAEDRVGREEEFLKLNSMQDDMERLLMLWRALR